MLKYFSKYYLILFFELIILNGCAVRYTGYGPHFSPVNKTIKKIALLYPEIYSFDVSEGGVNEFRADWSDIAKENLSGALMQQLGIKGFESVIIRDSGAAFCTDTVRAFIKTVTNEIQKRLYGENAFYRQIEKFDYSVGSISELCSYLQVDAVLFVFGLDENYSDERIRNLSKAASVKTAKSAFLGVLSSVFTGIGTYRVYSVPLERTYLSCTVADSSGKIIWYKKYLEADGMDLRTAVDAGKVAKSIIDGLRIGSK